MEPDNPIRILFVEDVPYDAEIAERELRKNGIQFTSTRVDTKETFLKTLEEFRPDIIISDYAMPEFDGMQALKLTKGYDSLIPFIILTGSINEETAVRCMKAGATDYVLKDRMKRLPFAVNEALGQKKMRLEKEKVGMALRESDERLREAQKMARLGHWRWNVKTGVVEWSEEIFKIFHLDPDKFIPQIDSIQALSPWPEYHERDKELIRRAMENREIGDYEQRFLRPDGSIGYYHSTFQGNYDDEGNLIFIIGTVQDITERKLAEEALRESEERFRTLVESAPEAIFVQSEGFYVYLNSAMLKLMRASMPEQLLGKEFMKQIAPEYHEAIRERIRVQCETRKPALPMEQEYLRLDGSRVSVETTAIAIRFQNRDAHLVFIRDITERKQKEEAIRESEAFIKAVLDNLPVGVAVNSVDPKVTFNYMNENFPRFYRTTREKLTTPDAFWSAVYEDTAFRETIRKRVLDDCASGNPEHMYWADIPITRKGEGTSFITARNIPVPNKPFMISTVLDVTARKLAEEEMKKLITAVEHSADWILITDREGRIEYVNKSVENISGYIKEELIGKNPGIFKSGKHNRKFFKEMWETICSGNIYSAIVTNRKKSGEIFELHYTITPLKDQDGNVHHFVATAKDITEKKLLEERLDYMAYYDSLTGLSNKKLFADRLAQSLSSAEQQRMNVAVLLLDIDRFTSLNETYGYETGDGILKETGRRLSQDICRDCTVGRIDADKFGMILVDIQHSEDVILALEKIQSTFKKPVKGEREEIVITLSAGIALFPGDGKEPEVLMQNAEVALAKAKTGGINMYQFFTAEMNKRATEFIRLQRHLFNALALNEFVMHYQPYFDSNSREMVGIEALIRWNSSEFGLVSPGLFIPILEETGMIIDVGKWIIQNVCRQIKEWMDKGYKSSLVPVYVNLSLAQFAQRDLSDFIEKTIGETGIYPSFLGFEITESIFMQDVQHTQGVLEKLRQKGISVNIDDFGTGYSSLSNLKRLPVNNLKIDISFIRDVTNNPDDASIVITIISMAHNLNLKTIAEGVETEEQWKILRILKCDMVQGYYFSKPLPAEKLDQIFLGGTIGQ
ncbi:MAG: EAL domain-containing protein [Thermodesulfovibrionales bacterium]|nr:EAL domain-containing protein [Thermodesulfovibrionales bacterium]